MKLDVTSNRDDHSIPKQIFENSRDNNVSKGDCQILDTCTINYCKVCGDRASGRHYGVVSCDGCRGFFKRSVRRQMAYICKENSNCPVDVARRNQCQACRFRRCLEMNMKKEAVQHERNPRRSQYQQQINTVAMNSNSNYVSAISYEQPDIDGKFTMSGRKRAHSMCKKTTLKKQNKQLFKEIPLKAVNENDVLPNLTENLVSKQFLIEYFSKFFNPYPSSMNDFDQIQPYKDKYSAETIEQQRSSTQDNLQKIKAFKNIRKQEEIRLLKCLWNTPEDPKYADKNERPASTPSESVENILSQGDVNNQMENFVKFCKLTSDDPLKPMKLLLQYAKQH